VIVVNNKIKQLKPVQSKLKGHVDLKEEDVF
jgi:hypothetical protein